ncbi:MAG: PAS domain-containing protein [Salinarimonas sp.]|nr:PAS domain-containing protein [Salinarimonas sp.]
MQPTTFRNQFSDVEDACALAQGIVDTVRQPVIVLDADLRVIAASRSFYALFHVSPEETQGMLLFALGDGQWDIPKLRILLEQIVPEQEVMQDYEVDHVFPSIGHRTMCLNARRLFYESGTRSTILLSIEDVTDRRKARREMEGLLEYKDTLLAELEHRIANSLQIVASIILMKARAVDSEETRLHLHDAHKRMISIAAVQRQLHHFTNDGKVDMASYLSTLCNTLSSSMISDARSISLEVVGAEGSASARQAESIGLIVTELVMNALKHAFPIEIDDGYIRVGYEVDGDNWKLVVYDNGVGKPQGNFPSAKVGLGTSIVVALTQQLEAVVETIATSNGTCVTISHARFEKTARNLANPSAILEEPRMLRTRQPTYDRAYHIVETSKNFK